MDHTSITHIHQVRTGPRGEPPIIFVHPVGLDLTYWGAQFEALHASHDLIAYDLPGNGDSPGTPVGWSLDSAVEVLASVVAMARSERVTLVGHSIGGMIAQGFALAHPEAMQALVLIGTAASFPEEQRRFARHRAATARHEGLAPIIPPTLERWFTPETRTQRPDILDRVVKSIRANDPAIYAAMWDMIASLNLAPRLAEINCPTLIMTGDQDPICPPGVAQAMHASITGSQWAIIPNAAHMCTLEQPGFINDCLARFLRGTGRSPTLGS